MKLSTSLFFSFSENVGRQYSRKKNTKSKKGKITPKKEKRIEKVRKQAEEGGK
jgi:RNA-splicing ligase RtcB